MLYPIKCVLNKRENLNFIVYNMITGRNKSKMLTRHISCKCKDTFDDWKCNLNQKRNNDKWWCQWKNPNEDNACEKIIFRYMHLWKFSKYYWLFNDYVAKIINAADSVSKM